MKEGKKEKDGEGRKNGEKNEGYSSHIVNYIVLESIFTDKIIIDKITHFHVIIIYFN